MPRITHRYHSCSLLLKPLLDDLAHARSLTRGAFDQHYAGIMGVSPATLNAWKHGRSRPNTPDQFRQLFKDAIALGRDRAWCEHLLESADASVAFRQSLLSELFDASKDSRQAPAQHAPFLAPPLSVHALVGRERELQAMRRQLTCDAGCSLAALRGLPGMGKTTLAIALAHDADLRRRFADGVLWHGLGREDSIEHGYARWARALGIDFAHAATRAEQAEAIHDAIGQKHMLLVIDDAWQAEDALAFKLGGPNCAHLLTTRFPDIAHDFAGTNVLELHALKDSDGLKLFAMIAPEATKAVPALARALTALGGGLPLAVQVIARQAWKAHLNGAGALHALEEALQSAGQRLVLALPRSPLEAPRHAATESTTVSPLTAIDVSFMRLTPWQRQALAALSLFDPKPNTFSHDAACSILSASDQDWQGLINSGLIDSAGEDRHTLHQVIHDYLNQQPLPDLAVQTYVFHWTNWLLFNTRDAALVEVEMTSLMRALKLAETQVPECHATLANGLYRTFNQRGRLAASTHLFDKALQVARACNDAGGEGWTQLNLGNLAWRLREDYDAAAAHVRQAIPLLQRAGHVYKACDAQAALADILLDAGQFEEAQRTYEIALEQARHIQEEQLVAHCLQGLGVLASRMNDSATAIAYYEQALPIAERSGYDGLVSGLLHNLGCRHVAIGDARRAAQYFGESVRFSHKRRLHARVAETMLELSRLAGGNNTAMAERIARQAVRYAKKHNAERSLMHAQAGLGQMLMRMGRLPEANIHLNDALSAARHLRNVKVQSAMENELGCLGAAIP
jgi:tetratricopeptide (TPR) repeat protein